MYPYPHPDGATLEELMAGRVGQYILVFPDGKAAGTKNEHNRFSDCTVPCRAKSASEVVFHTDIRDAKSLADRHREGTYDGRPRVHKIESVSFTIGDAIPSRR